MKLHKFVNDYFWNGQVKYRAGSHYEPNDETRVAVVAGHAEAVDAGAEQARTPFTHEPAYAAKEEKPKKDKDGDK